jgi:hypothetical protein
MEREPKTEGKDMETEGLGSSRQAGMLVHSDSVGLQSEVRTVAQAQQPGGNGKVGSTGRAGRRREKGKAKADGRFGDG